MSIAGVCVDRGRLLTKEPSAVRTEGRTSFVPVADQWFKCRLFLGASNDVADPQGGHFSSVNQPQVMTVVKDLSGTPLDIHGEHRLDIASNELGRAVWRVMGEPQPIRKKRRVIGFLANVERVVEREYDDLLAQNVPTFAHQEGLV